MARVRYYFKFKIGEIENVNKTENNTGATGLMFAAMNGNVELIKILIGFGAELDAKDTVYGWTALMQATFYGRKEATEIMLRVHFSRNRKFEKNNCDVIIFYTVFPRIVSFLE